ncbi:MAG: N-acetyl-gamma-glutamyl-phosphate reductase [Myxococcaceae bacterium]|nr:N-acetyl-gamma-glutamyl-phosphate reductase [Myxococcaceae bacterium]MCA3016107.1 N-acetyl-gamma-glutamyl-phosphate reductase [Myxococcaceae bacterium]
MSLARVGIIGASGYSGLDLTRLLFGHGQVVVDFLTSDRWVGQTVSARSGVSPRDGHAATYVSVEEGLQRAGGCAAVFLATPAETSLELAPKLLAAGTRVIDLAGTYRLKDAALYPPFYKLTHPAPELLTRAVYGLPELFRERVAGQRFIANPGCYPTAAALSVAPLLRAGLVALDSIVINAASGVSGAGRKASEEYTFMEVDADFRAYKVLGHQHTPEIEQTLSDVAGAPVSIVFTPHLLPMKRGILSTATLLLKPGVDEATVRAAFEGAYVEEPLVRLLASADAVRIADVANTPRCLVGVSVKGRRCVSIAAIDNLLKGAASQAVQNLNLALGLSETTGLG